MVVMLKCKLNAFACHFGIKCSSFCKVNIGTSMRSACASLGFTTYNSVSISNKLLERNQGYLLNMLLMNLDRCQEKTILFKEVRYHINHYELTTLMTSTGNPLCQDMLPGLAMHGAWRHVVSRAAFRVAARVLPNMETYFAINL